MTASPLPLSRRVSAPASVVLAAHPDVAEWRPGTADDIDSLVVLEHAMGLIDHPDYVTEYDEIADTFTYSFVDPEVDSLVGVGHDGSIVAYGTVHLGPGQDTRVQSYLGGGVHPDLRRRGIGGMILEWQGARSLQQLASSDKTLPGWTIGYAWERTEGAVRMFEKAGFSIGRYFTSMNRILAEPIPAIEVASPVRLVPYRSELNEATRLARNDAFRDHWGSQPSMPETWNSFTEGHNFRADLSWVAVVDGEDGEQVVGLVLSEVNEPDWEAQGFTSAYIALVGVGREWRGRKLAPALLAKVLGSMREAGLEQAVLDVDTASPTGALGLYEGMGFRATNRSLALIREV